MNLRAKSNELYYLKQHNISIFLSKLKQDFQKQSREKMFGSFFAETSTSKSCDFSDLRRKKPGTLCSYTAGFLIV